VADTAFIAVRFFWDRPSYRYFCYGNCTAGFKPI